MQAVAFDPFPAVEQAAQFPPGAGHRKSQGRLNRMDGAHLVGHRADAADAGREVRGLGAPAPPQEGLEKAGRFEDLKLAGVTRPSLILSSGHPRPPPGPGLRR